MKENVENKTKESGLVVTLSVIGFVLGLIGMLGSFIPCIGTMALYIAIPAVLISGASVFLAYQKGVGIAFPVASLTISMIGLTASGIQYFSIVKAVKESGNALKAIMK
jgi:hypothetical protein